MIVPSLLISVSLTVNTAWNSHEQLPLADHYESGLELMHSSPNRNHCNRVMGKFRFL